MEVRESDIGYVPRIEVAEKLHSANEELNRIKEDHYSLMVVPQKKLEWVKRELKERDVLIKTLREAAKARKCGGG